MNTEDILLFVQTADSGSITQAAQTLDITTAAASAGLKRLEKQLDTLLFVRSTRHLRITEEGERFLVHARDLLSSLSAGKESIKTLKGKVAGTFTISAPSDLGRQTLLPWFDDIMRDHSELSIHLILDDTLSDFYLDRVDVAIRYGTLQDSSAVAFKLTDLNRVLCASPSYLATHGFPHTPDDLTKHNCLCFQLNNRTYNQWNFYKKLNGKIETKTVTVSGNRVANDGDVVRRWALADKGIAYKSRLDIREDLKLGKLINLLPEYNTVTTELNLICPNKKRVTPAVLLFRDLLRDRFNTI